MTKRAAAKLIKLHEDKFTKEAIDAINGCDKTTSYFIMNSRFYPGIQLRRLLIRAHNTMVEGRFDYDEKTY